MPTDKRFVTIGGVPDQLVGVAEIKDLLGVSKQRVNQIIQGDPAFPAPVATLTAGRIWSAEDVEAWAVATGRLKAKRQRKKVAR